MTDRQKKLIRRIAFSAAAFTLLVPVTVSSNEGLDANNACATGACCQELNSVCDGDSEPVLHYYGTSTKCAPTQWES